MRTVFRIGCFVVLSSFAGCTCMKNPSPSTPSSAQKIEISGGLSYIVLKPGDATAPQATPGKLVTVHYTGWLDNKGEPGAKFDSSLDRGLPFTFKLGAGHVIQGWDKGVAGMRKGEKRRLIIPAAFGYGDRGAGGMIPGGATLIFDVELLGVE